MVMDVINKLHAAAEKSGSVSLSADEVKRLRTAVMGWREEITRLTTALEAKNTDPGGPLVVPPADPFR